MKYKLMGIVVGAGLLLIAMLVWGQTAITGFDDRLIIVWEQEDLFTAATDTTLSPAYYVGNAQYFGIYYQATSESGSPNITIELLQSYKKTATFVIPEGAGAVVSGLTDENPHVKGMQPAPMRYLKIRVRGLSGNATDTKVTVVLFTQPPAKTI